VTDSTLAIAHTYANNGWRIIPIPPAKKYPEGIARWQERATTDHDTITTWWGTDYPDHGIGIATGAASGIWVLDIDDYDSYRDLEQRHEPLPDTLTVITGSGGYHFYYRYPDRTDIRNNASTRLGPGLDVRGDGGFVVAPPSVHPNGNTYQWDAGQPEHIADAPAWLIELVSEQPATPTTTPLTNITAGDRPGDIYAAQVDWATILEADGWTLHHTDRNGERHWTRPGKERRDGTSATTGWSAADNLKVFTSSMRHAGLEPEESYTKLGYIAATRHHGDHSAAARTLADYGFRNTQTDPTPVDGVTAEPVADGINPLAKFILDWPEFWATDHTATDWIVEPLFAAGRAHALYAGAKTGKSYLVLAAVAALATGKPFLDKPAGQPVDVLYVDYEMTPDDLHDRLVEFGYGPADNLSRLHYALLPSMPPLDTDAGGLTLTMAAQKVGAEFVVIDTTGRATEGDENEASTFQAFYRHTGMRLKQQGIGWVRLDHAGKDAEKGQRGSSAKNDDVDIVMKLTRNDTGVTVDATHRRMGWYPERTAIDIGEDGHGVMAFTATRGTDHKPYAVGTVELAKKLDQLDIPLEMSRRAARPILTAAGVTATNQVLGDALRFRRNAAQHAIDTIPNPVDNPVDNSVDISRTTPRTTLSENGGGPLRTEHPETAELQPRTTPRTTTDHSDRVTADQWSPLRGTTVQTPDDEHPLTPQPDWTF
jgi:hypothetical protein